MHVVACLGEGAGRKQGPLDICNLKSDPTAAALHRGKAQLDLAAIRDAPPIGSQVRHSRTRARAGLHRVAIQHGLGDRRGGSPGVDGHLRPLAPLVLWLQFGGV
eukprot:10878402-Alexandrium_andersonii.AAC.1